MKSYVLLYHSRFQDRGCRFSYPLSRNSVVGPNTYEVCRLHYMHALNVFFVLQADRQSSFLMLLRLIIIQQSGSRMMKVIGMNAEKKRFVFPQTYHFQSGNTPSYITIAQWTIGNHGSNGSAVVLSLLVIVNTPHSSPDRQHVTPCNANKSHLLCSARLRFTHDNVIRKKARSVRRSPLKKLLHSKNSYISSCLATQLWRVVGICFRLATERLPHCMLCSETDNGWSVSRRGQSLT